MVAEYALDHGIYILCLPSHLTHILQPLDVRVLGVLTRQYNREFDDFVCETGIEDISKPES